MSATRSSKILLLCLFPFYCMLTGAYFRTLLGDLSLRTIDPDYVYFSNGLDISLGNFNTGNIFHPGAPLQYFAAIIFRLVYLLRSPGIPYAEDIFSNPDIYLSAVSFNFIGLLAFVILIAGWKTYQHTGSVISGMLIQATSFLPIIWYDIIGRVTPEVWQAIAVLALSVLLIKAYKTDKESGSGINIYTMALIAAFGLSAKVTFLPMLLIPFVVIDTWKKRTLFILLTLMLFVLMSVSILFKLDLFWSWIKNIFIHSGSYGGGDANFIDFQAFKDNLISLVLLEKFYFQVVLFCLLLLSIAMIFFRRKINRMALFTVAAMILTIVLQLLLVSKHFAHRNFIPSLLLMPTLLYFSVELTKQFSNSQLYKSSVTILILLFFVFFIRGQLIWLPIKSEAMGSHIAALEETRHFTSTLEEGCIKIITSQNYGAPFKEYALLYSTVWSSRSMKPEYDKILATLYPDTYQFTTWDDKFQFWGEPFDAQKIVESGKQIYIYTERDDAELYARTIQKLHVASSTEFTEESDVIYKNTVTSETIYRLKIQLTP